MKKIVLVGCGAVGSSFIYSAINQGLAEEYILIDKFKNLAEGNALDLGDVQASLESPFTAIKVGDFQDCKDADLIVITAGRPRKVGETRLDMVSDNAKIISDIALEIKLSGFKGITLIASNPVDVMTAVYQKVTGFDVHKVLGAGTILDTLRLKYLLGQKLEINPESIFGYVLAEHGDSAFIPWSNVIVANQSILEVMTKEELELLEQAVKTRAGEIIKLKNATFYGIAAGLTFLIKMMMKNQDTMSIAGAYLNGEYDNQGFYIGVPVILNQNGWKEVVQLPLTNEEQLKFNHSCQIIKENLKVALSAIADKVIKSDERIEKVVIKE